MQAPEQKSVNQREALLLFSREKGGGKSCIFNVPWYAMYASDFV